MLNLLGRRKKIEKFLNENVMIFGEKYNVKIIYGKFKNPQLELQGKIIYVFLPNKYKKEGNIYIVKMALEKMYFEIARIEIEKVMEETRIMLKGLAPENYKIRKIADNRLAKCSENNIITINPEIIKYKKDVLKYVILYEFCHLKYKKRVKGFYQMLEKYMPDYEQYLYIFNAA